jgi:hypothetical protein
MKNEKSEVLNAAFLLFHSSFFIQPLLINKSYEFQKLVQAI